MECNYKSAEWYNEKHPEPDQKTNSIDFGLEKVGLLQYTCPTNTKTSVWRSNSVEEKLW
jgi:hypothetical protein